MTDFDRRLRKAREKAGLEKPADDKRPPSIAGPAMRMASELIAGVLVGGFIGWWIDRWFGTAPFGLIGFMAFGTVVGVINVIGTVKKLNRELGAGTGPAQQPEENEE